MKDYHAKRATLLDGLGSTHPLIEVVMNTSAEVAKLEDEKRIFDLRFQAACAILSGNICNNQAIEDVVSEGLKIADELLKQMKVTE